MADFSEHLTEKNKINQHKLNASYLPTLSKIFTEHYQNDHGFTKTFSAAKFNNNSSKILQTELQAFKQNQQLQKQLPKQYKL